MGKRKTIKPVKAWSQYAAVSAGGTYLEEVGADPAQMQKQRPTCVIFPVTVSVDDPTATRSTRISAAQRRVVEAAVKYRKCPVEQCVKYGFALEQAVDDLLKLERAKETP